MEKQFSNRGDFRRSIHDSHDVVHVQSSNEYASSNTVSRGFHRKSDLFPSLYTDNAPRRALFHQTGQNFNFPWRLQYGRFDRARNLYFLHLLLHDTYLRFFPRLKILTENLLRSATNADHVRVIRKVAGKYSQG